MRSALMLAFALTTATGCVSLDGLSLFGAKDPMQTELEQLEQEQRRIAKQERALSEAEDRKRRDNPKTLDERLALGDAHLANGELALALWEYAAAHRLAPESPAPRIRLGYVHLRHQPERAQPLFESALERDPENVSALIGLGLSMLAGQDSETGLSHLERAVEVAPDSAKARAAFGVSLDRLGRTEAALTHLEVARELAPHDARILNNLAVAHLRAGAPERAEPLLRAALRQDARDVALRSNNLGMALAMQGRFDEALEAFLKGGDEQAAHSNLGYAHHLRGEYARAVAEYEKALVAGGERTVQVIRNMRAARTALGQTAPVPEDTAGEEPAAPSQVADEPYPDDPWLREAPPGDLAD